MGYARKGSFPSLIMGMASGLLLFYAAYQVSLSPQNAPLGLLICASLAIMMGYRFFQSGAFMPAGLVAGLSVAMGGRYLLKLLSEEIIIIMEKSWYRIFERLLPPQQIVTASSIMYRV